MNRNMNAKSKLIKVSKTVFWALYGGLIFTAAGITLGQSLFVSTLMGIGLSTVCNLGYLYYQSNQNGSWPLTDYESSAKGSYRPSIVTFLKNLLKSPFDLILALFPKQKEIKAKPNVNQENGKDLNNEKIEFLNEQFKELNKKKIELEEQQKNLNMEKNEQELVQARLDKQAQALQVFQDQLNKQKQEQDLNQAGLNDQAHAQLLFQEQLNNQRLEQDLNKAGLNDQAHGQLLFQKQLNNQKDEQDLNQARLNEQSHAQHLHQEQLNRQKQEQDLIQEQLDKGRLDLETDKQKFKKKIKNKNAEIEEISKNIYKDKKLIDHMRDKVAQESAEALLLKNRLQEKNDELDLLREDLLLERNLLNERISEVEQKEKDLEQKLQDIEITENQFLQRAYQIQTNENKLEIERKKLNEVKESLRDMEALLNNERSKFQDNLDQKHQEIQSLNLEIERLNKVIESQHFYLDNNKKEILTVKKSLDETKLNLDTTSKEKQLIIDEHEKTNKELLEKIKAEQRDFEKFKSLIERDVKLLKEETRQSDNETVNLRADNARLFAQLNYQEEKISQHNRDLESIKASYQNKIAELNKIIENYRKEKITSTASEFNTSTNNNFDESGTEEENTNKKSKPGNVGASIFTSSTKKSENDEQGNRKRVLITDEDETEVDSLHGDDGSSLKHQHENEPTTYPDLISPNGRRLSCQTPIGTDEIILEACHLAKFNKIVTNIIHHINNNNSKKTVNSQNELLSLLNVIIDKNIFKEDDILKGVPNLKRVTLLISTQVSSDDQNKDLIELLSELIKHNQTVEHNFQTIHEEFDQGEKTHPNDILALENLLKILADPKNCVKDTTDTSYPNLSYGWNLKSEEIKENQNFSSIHINFLGTTSAPLFVSHDFENAQTGHLLSQLSLASALNDEPTLLVRGISTNNFEEDFIIKALRKPNIQVAANHLGSTAVVALGWGADERIKTAMNNFLIPTLFKVLNTEDCSLFTELNPVLTIKICGHSRGAITTYIMAILIDKFINLVNDGKYDIDNFINTMTKVPDIFSETDTKEIKTVKAKKFFDKLKESSDKIKIQMIGYDPVEGLVSMGDGSIGKDTPEVKTQVAGILEPIVCNYSSLPPRISKALIFLAKDERRSPFKPTLPHFSSETLVNVELVDGKHGTLVGNFGNDSASGQFNYKIFKDFPQLKRISLGIFDRTLLKSYRFLYQGCELPPLPIDLLRRILTKESVYVQARKVIIELLKSNFTSILQMISDDKIQTLHIDCNEEFFETAFSGNHENDKLILDMTLKLMRNLSQFNAVIYQVLDQNIQTNFELYHPQLLKLKRQMSRDSNFGKLIDGDNPIEPRGFYVRKVERGIPEKKIRNLTTFQQFTLPSILNIQAPMSSLDLNNDLTIANLYCDAIYYFDFLDTSYNKNESEFRNVFSEILNIIDIIRNNQSISNGLKKQMLTNLLQRFCYTISLVKYTKSSLPSINELFKPEEISDFIYHEILNISIIFKVSTSEELECLLLEKHQLERMIEYFNYIQQQMSIHIARIGFNIYPVETLKEIETLKNTLIQIYEIQSYIDALQFYIYSKVETVHSSQNEILELINSLKEIKFRLVETSFNVNGENTNNLEAIHTNILNNYVNTSKVKSIYGTIKNFAAYYLLPERLGDLIKSIKGSVVHIKNEEENISKKVENIQKLSNVANTYLNDAYKANSGRKPSPAIIPAFQKNKNAKKNKENKKTTPKIERTFNNRLLRLSQSTSSSIKP